MESEKKKEKYLTIQLLGKNGIRVAAFKNKERKDNAPHYLGNGVAVWINDMPDKKEETVEDTI